MTFWYDESDNKLVGNLAFDEELGYAEQDGEELVLDVDAIMDDRGIGKLNEMKRAIESAIEANEKTNADA